MRGAANGTEASFSFSRSAAGFIRLEWNGADTGKGRLCLAPIAFRMADAFSTPAFTRRALATSRAVWLTSQIATMRAPGSSRRASRRSAA